MFLQDGHSGWTVFVIMNSLQITTPRRTLYWEENNFQRIYDESNFQSMMCIKADAWLKVATGLQLADSGI